MLPAVAQDFDFGGCLGFAVKVEGGGLVGMLIAACDPIEDGICREVHKFGPEVEA